MVFSGPFRLGTIFSVGFGGWLIGYFQQKYSKHPVISPYLSSLPPISFIENVSAATPMVLDEQNKPAKADQDLTKHEQVKSRIQQIMKFGFPSLDNIISYQDFIISYDRRNRVPKWVYEHITKESVKHNDAVNRSNCLFFEDPSVHKYFRSENTDYKGSGFDRGHMAAAGNHRLSQKYCEETFVLSNIAPQVGRGFNRDSWNRLEKYTRKQTKTYPNVYVCTGPLYLPKKESDGNLYVKYQVIGKNWVAVPTHFFKVLILEKEDSSIDIESYVMPNTVIEDSTPLTNFLVPIDTIERHSGLLFYDRIAPKVKKVNGKGIGWF